jgi:hypothetical protein
VTNVNTVEVPIKQAMLGAAARRVLLADSSKFGRRALATVVGIDAFDHVVTDDGLAAELRRAYGERLVCVRLGSHVAAPEDAPTGLLNEVRDDLAGDSTLTSQAGLRGRRLQRRRSLSGGSRG